MRKQHWIPLDEIQGNVTPGFRKDHQAFLFFRFPAVLIRHARALSQADELNPATSKRQRAAAAAALANVRAWLHELQPYIASAETVATFNRLHRLVRGRIRGSSLDDKGAPNDPEKGVKRFARSTWVNVAFTADGLRCLIGHEPWANGKPLEERLAAFAAGMCRRQHYTHDPVRDIAEFTVRDSMRTDWARYGVTPADEESQVAHAVVIIAADDKDTLLREVRRLSRGANAKGVKPIAALPYVGKTLGNAGEHFGFTDSVSQPDPDDPLAGWISDGEDVVAPGEFIRGCEPEPESRDTANVPAWERYGSYLVLRKLEQDVELFWQQAQAFADQLFPGAAGATGAAKPSAAATFVAAKMVGRWPSGAALTVEVGSNVAPNVIPTDPGTVDDPPGSAFVLSQRDFSDDERGSRCPLFAHSRKANPRVPIDGVKPSDLRIHRIIRRGIPYDDGVDGSGTPKKGLIFLAYQARIDRGFEYVQDQWLNNPELGLASPDPTRPGDPRDPYPGTDPFSVIDELQRHPLQTFVPAGGAIGMDAHVPHAQLRTVTAKGGGYFFTPSIRVIELMATGSALLEA